MNQILYWHAPLWEVLAIVLTGLAVLSWLVVCATRRIDPATVLPALNPALETQPLFLFDRLAGITPLNTAAQHTLRISPVGEVPGSLDILTDVLAEAYAEGHLVQYADWPEPGAILLAMPLLEEAGKITGTLAVVLREPAPLVEPPLLEMPATPIPDAWESLGSTLQYHRTLPVVRVWRGAGPPVAGAEGWDEQLLRPPEMMLLRMLCDRSGEAQPADMLYHAIWPEDEIDRYGDLRPDQRNRLRGLVYRLRRHIEPDPRNPQYLCTAHGVGYVLYVNVEQSHEA